MDLREWMLAQHADVTNRVTTQVLVRVPADRRDERPCDGSSSISWLLWHALRHQDVAVNAVVRGGGCVHTPHGYAVRMAMATDPVEGMSCGPCLRTREGPRS